MFSTVSTKDKQHTPFNSWSRCKEGLLHDMKPWRIHDLRRIARSLMSRAGGSNNNTERVFWHTIAGLGSAFLPHRKVRRVDRLAASGAKSPIRMGYHQRSPLRDIVNTPLRPVEFTTPCSPLRARFCRSWRQLEPHRYLSRLSPRARRVKS